MSDYRIIEKKGEYKDVIVKEKAVTKTTKCWGCDVWGESHSFAPHYHTNYTDETVPEHVIKEYVPRFIVQVLRATGTLCLESCYHFVDLKEFDNLDDARAFKRDSELEDGVVIE